MRTELLSNEDKVEYLDAVAILLGEKRRLMLPALGISPHCDDVVIGIFERIGHILRLKEDLSANPPAPWLSWCSWW